MGGSRAHSRKILCVDDDVSVRELLDAILTQAGYSVAQAESGAEGIRKALADPPDLFILDLQMPGMDGLELCRRVKREPALREAPVVMCTAETRRDFLLAAIRAGADDYIPKPFTVGTVLTRLRRLLVTDARSQAAVRTAHLTSEI